MSYIGNTVENQNYVPAIDYFNGDGSTVAFTLSRPVASVAAVQAVISNVPQNPGSAFTVSGSTITFTSAPPSGTANIYVYYTSPNTQVIQPGQGTVGTTQLASVTGSGAVALASLPSFTTTIGVGGATPAATGAGITFPATQSASSDANTLDDYEEGTWTPGVVGATFSGTTVTGRYIKIGRQVTVFWELQGNWSSASGQAQISGLPFVPDTDVTKGGYSTAQFRASTALSGGTAPLTGWLDGSASRIYVENYNAASSASASWVNGSGLRTTGMAVYLSTT